MTRSTVVPNGFLSLITGSFAMPAAENPTVVMIEAAYRHHGVDARYLNVEIPPESLADAVRGARAMGWAGFNCSLPHKVSVIALIDGLTPAAEIIGAVNCVVRVGEELIGDNTDGQGFLSSLQSVTDPTGAHVVVLGAGGAARAIAVQTALAGAARFTIVNRDPARAEPLIETLRSRTPAAADFVPWQGDYSVPPDADIVVNATSVGLFPDVEARLALDLASLRPTMWVADVIPNPAQTRFLREAAALGCRTLDGQGMLVNQGVISVLNWTGVQADPGVMREAVRQVLPA